MTFLRLKTLTKAKYPKALGVPEELYNHYLDYFEQQDVEFISIYDDSSIVSTDFRDELHLHSHGANKAASLIDAKLDSIMGLRLSKNIQHLD